MSVLPEPIAFPAAPARRVAALLLAVTLGGLLALTLMTGRSVADPYPPGPAPSSASNFANGCTVSTSTVNAGPGDTLTLVGSGFAPKETVSLSIPAASAALGSVTTDASGSFNATFTWPASVNGKSALVQASAPSTTCAFTLTNAKSQRDAASGNGANGLSPTGFATIVATTIAIALLGSGALFLGLARRQRV